VVGDLIDSVGCDQIQKYWLGSSWRCLEDFLSLMSEYFVLLFPLVLFLVGVDFFLTTL
jgi:hypothetical protein